MIDYTLVYFHLIIDANLLLLLLLLLFLAIIIRFF